VTTPVLIPTAVRQLVVLVVEDESLVRMVKRDILELAGHLVLEAASADEALALAAAQPGVIDVLVTDLTLPGLQGDALAALLRAERPGLGLVFTSGYCEADGPCERFPGSLFLQKPFRPDALAAAVDAVAGP
jgi:CheY-like chemotaxis protein